MWCAGFSLQWIFLLKVTGSRVVGFHSCGSWALEQGSAVVTLEFSCSMACGIFLDQIEPMSPVWQVDFFTMEPPSEPRIKALSCRKHVTIYCLYSDFVPTCIWRGLGL